MTNIILKYTNEFCPDINSIGWVNFDGIMILKSNITYQIRKKLCKHLHEICGKNTNCNLLVDYKNTGVVIIYVVNNTNGQSYIGHSKIPLILFMKYNVCSKILGRRSVFDYFNHNEFANYSFKILEYVMPENIKELNERKYFLETVYLENSTGQKKSQIKKYISMSGDILLNTDKFYAKRIKIFDAIYDKFQHLDYIYVNIYKLTNNTNEKVYITGDTKKLTKSDMFNNLLKHNNDLSKDITEFANYFDFSNTECCKVRSIIEYQIRLDYHIIKSNGVTEGYNNAYLLEESKILFNSKFLSSQKKKVTKNLFLKINMCLIDKYIIDVGDYSDIYGMIYKIERISTEEKYFGISHAKNLKQIIKSKYQFAIDHIVKHDKLLKILMEIPYDNFSFEIVNIKKNNDYTTDLDKYLLQYIKKYDTINTGYNIDRSKNSIF